MNVTRHQVLPLIPTPGFAFSYNNGSLCAVCRSFSWEALYACTPAAPTPPCPLAALAERPVSGRPRPGPPTPAAPGSPTPVPLPGTRPRGPGAVLQPLPPAPGARRTTPPRP